MADDNGNTEHPAVPALRLDLAKQAHDVALGHARTAFCAVTVADTVHLWQQFSRDDFVFKLGCMACLLLDLPPSWETAQRALSDEKSLHSIQQLHPGSIQEGTRLRLMKLITEHGMLKRAAKLQNPTATLMLTFIAELVRVGEQRSQEEAGTELELEARQRDQASAVPLSSLSMGLGLKQAGGAGGSGSKWDRKAHRSRTRSGDDSSEPASASRSPGMHAGAGAGAGAARGSTPGSSDGSSGGRRRGRGSSRKPSSRNKGVGDADASAGGSGSHGSEDKATPLKPRADVRRQALPPLTAPASTTSLPQLAPLRGMTRDNLLSRSDTGLGLRSPNGDADSTSFHTHEALLTSDPKIKRDAGLTTAAVVPRAARLGLRMEEGDPHDHHMGGEGMGGGASAAGNGAGAAAGMVAASAAATTGAGSSSSRSNRNGSTAGAAAGTHNGSGSGRRRGAGTGGSEADVQDPTTIAESPQSIDEMLTAVADHAVHVIAVAQARMALSELKEHDLEMAWLPDMDAKSPKVLLGISGALCVMFNRKPTWDAARNIVLCDGFLAVLAGLEPSLISSKVLRVMSAVSTDQQFAKWSKKSSATTVIRILAQWISAFTRTHDRTPTLGVIDALRQRLLNCPIPAGSPGCSDALLNAALTSPTYARLRQACRALRKQDADHK